MRRIEVVVILLLLINVRVHGQSNYELQDLSAVEYMQAVPAIVEQAYTEEINTTIRHVIGQEFALRFTDENLTNMPSDLLLNFQTALAIGADPFLPQDTKIWLTAILETGLRDEHINDFSGEFDVGNYHVISTRVNFDGDDVEDYLLEVHDNWSGRIFYALLSDQLHSVPLPITGMQSSVLTRALPQTGRLTTRQLADLDDDGRTEWIVEADNYGYWASCGNLYVLDWQRDKLVNRTQDLFHYCVPLAQSSTASIEYVYSQPNQLQMIESRTDGWNCQRVKSDTLNLFTATLASTITYANTPWCMLREADKAFCEGDYRTAANIYAQVVSNFDDQMAQYLYARLALSYALDEQPQHVQETLNMTDSSGQMGDLLLRLRNTSGNPSAMCRAAYDFFVETNDLAEDPFDNPYPWIPEYFYFGHEPGDPRYFPLPIPSQAGCDYEQVLGLEPTPILAEENSFDLQLAGFVRSGIYEALLNGQYQQVQEHLDVILSAPVSDYEAYAQELVYWQALTFEFMQQPEQALATYVILYESAPESAFGKLASLHLKEVNSSSLQP